MTIIPPENKLWVNTPLGYGLVFGVETFGQSNAMWTVILQKDGRILHYDSLQLRAGTNHTDEINLENHQPPFPAF